MQRPFVLETVTVDLFLVRYLSACLPACLPACLHSQPPCPMLACLQLLSAGAAISIEHHVIFACSCNHLSHQPSVGLHLCITRTRGVMSCQGHVEFLDSFMHSFAAGCSVSVPSPNVVGHGTPSCSRKSPSVQEVCCVPEAVPQHPHRCGGPAGRVGSPLL